MRHAVPFLVLAAALAAATSVPAQQPADPPRAEKPKAAQPKAEKPKSAAAGSSGWRLPPEVVARVLDAPPTPDALFSPDAKWALFVERPAMPSIAEVSRPWTGLAGIRVDPALRAPHTTTSISGLVLRDVALGTTQAVVLPADARVLDVSWAPRNDRFAFTAAGERGLELYVVGVPGGTPEKVPLASPLVSVLGRPYTWLPEGQGILARTVPLGQSALAAPERAVPSGPSVQETSGRSSPLRTYQDLLSSSADEAAFRHYAECQLVEYLFPTKTVRKIGPVGLISGADVSPDGQHVLVTRIVEPFSYVLGWWSFPMSIEVWSRAGNREAVIAEVTMGDDIPMEGVRTTPRDVQWQPTSPATLWFCTALDGGDPRQPAEKRDRWSYVDAPFTQAPQTAFELEWRARGLDWMRDGAHVLAAEYDRDRKWKRTRLHDLTRPGEKPRTVEDRSVNDRYGDPGDFVATTLPTGDRVLRQDGNWLYRFGRGASAEGDRPFVDRYEFTTGTTERLWRCSENVYERPLVFTRGPVTAKPAVVTQRESADEPPNYWLRDLGSGATVRLTDFGDPQPAMRNVEQKLVKYERADGVALSATLYVPKDRPAGARLPLFVWAYPQEFTDASTAGQVSGSPNRFVRVRGPSPVLFALHGWAVMDNASMPVVGDPETVNDTFLDQIVMNAKAAIDEADRLGVADPNRCAVGGHSYGAFMTANLLAHCDLFKAGVCRSGAYNRTLTPFGFQNERRTIWQAPKAYIQLSPFFAADKIDEPILLIHGEKDDNPGTFPIQSERLYQAIKGNGGTARLVVLPGEAHGYRARESVMATVAEMFDWCDEYVRDVKTDVGEKPMEAGSPR